MTKRKAVWHAGDVKALRRHLRLTQDQMAEELGTRQQTISEWETGMYQPRGLSERLLTLVAEGAGFAYDASSESPDAPPDPGRPLDTDDEAKPAHGRCCDSAGTALEPGRCLGGLVVVMVASRLEATEVIYRPRDFCNDLQIAEPPPDPISEAELSIIWAEQRYPAGALATPAGQPVAVVFPGRKGGAAGPDFRDAVLRIEGEERRGDVELHVRASYFRSHGHHLDPAYDALALHVVYLADDGAYTTLNSGGSTPVAAFAPWVEQRSANLQLWLAGPPLWQEPCFDAVSRHGPGAVREVLATTGRERIAARSQRLCDEAAEIGDAEALWRALFDVLGQGGDREGFRRLSRVLTLGLAQTIRRVHGTSMLEAGLLCAGGLVAVPAGLETILPPPLRPALQGGTGRPANRPQRRLAAVAQLVDRADGDLAGYAAQSVTVAKDAAALVSAWQIPGLLGPEKAAELVLNVVLPLAERTPSLTAKARELTAQLPAQRAYGKTEFLERHLRRPDGKRLVRTALEQQGLLALLGDWCSQGGCGHCPLS